MPAVRSLNLPTRRCLLRTGAVPAPLGLAGCEPEAGLDHHAPFGISVAVASAAK